MDVRLGLADMRSCVGFKEHKSPKAQEDWLCSHLSLSVSYIVCEYFHASCAQKSLCSLTEIPCKGSIKFRVLRNAVVFYTVSLYLGCYQSDLFCEAKTKQLVIKKQCRSLNLIICDKCHVLL